MEGPHLIDINGCNFDLTLSICTQNNVTLTANSALFEFQMELFELENAPIGDDNSNN